MLTDATVNISVKEEIMNQLGGLAEMPPGFDQLHIPGWEDDAAIEDEYAFEDTANYYDETATGEFDVFNGDGSLQD